MKIQKILPLTALLMSAACQNAQPKKDLSNQVVALKTEFIQACESTLDRYDLYGGDLDQIITRRNKLPVNDEYWWCGNEGGLYQATFPQTNFPNPVRYKIK